METSRIPRALPLYSSPKDYHPSHGVILHLPRRWTKGIVPFFVIVSCIFYFFVIPHFRGPLLPPLYSAYHSRDLQLPQHNPNLSYPEGKDGKYIWIANQCDGVGWGNYMQEFMLDAYVVYQAGWSNVFSNYTWNKQGGPYTKYGNGLIPSRIPLSALVQGPLVGGHWQDGDPTPRSVVKEFWDEICPEFERVVIDPREIDGNELGNIQASVLVDKWLQKLSTIKSRCVEIDRDSLQMFSFWTFGNGQRLLDVWPSYSTSPIITQFRWSSLIETAFQYNHRLFTHSLSSVHPYNTVPGLLALHIRRGDYQDHCEHLAKYGSIFNGFNSFPELQDQFIVPETDNEAIKRRIYMKSCLPTFEEIVEKIVEVRRSEEGRGLRDIYIMTNGPQDWVTELKDVLRKSGEWGRIVSSRDLTLSWEQRYVGQAVDMLIGQRAQVMIGNGFSSLTSNIVMFRMARGVPPNSNRLW